MTTHTPICDLLGIDTPVVQAGMGVFTSAELVAAVSNAGGLGSLGAGLRPVDDLRSQLTRIRELTDRPFAVNHTLNSTPDPESIAVTIEAKPVVMSFALGDPVEYVEMAHDAGICVMHQVTTVAQAQQALSRGVDIIVAQGSEGGGFGGRVSTLTLVPQVVDIADKIPVLAAGGVADGRGMAAMLILGAQGVNIGTRFLASEEAPISPEWKMMITGATSEQTVKFDVWDTLFPTRPGGYEISPRTLHAEFVDRWNHRPEEARDHAEEIRTTILAAIRGGRMHEVMPWAGETVGLIEDVQPAGQIVRDITREAEAYLEAC